MEYEDPLESRLCLALLGVLILATVVFAGRWAWFFLLQAIVPWLAAVAVFLFTGRSIVQDRYLVFAQVGLFGLWVITWQLLPGRTSRLLLIVFLCPAQLVGLTDRLSQLPDREPAMQEAAEWLKSENVDNDLFLIEDYRYVNLFRYYTSLAGLPWLDVKARAPRFNEGHIVQLGSLQNSDLYWSEEELWRDAPPRVWLICLHAGSPSLPTPGRRPVLTCQFNGGGSTSVALVRCEAEP